MTQSTAHTPTFVMDFMNYDFTSYSDNQVEELISYGGIIDKMKKNLIDSIDGMMDCFGLDNIEISETNAYRTDYHHHISHDKVPFQLDTKNPALNLNKAEKRWEITYSELEGTRSYGIPLEKLDIEEIYDLFGALAECE